MLVAETEAVAEGELVTDEVGVLVPLVDGEDVADRVGAAVSELDVLAVGETEALCELVAV